MNFETTTCISHEHREILELYAKKYNVSLRNLIAMLVQYIAEHEKIMFNGNRRIKYRSRKGPHTWQRLHIVLYPQEYEFVLDVKKVYKMSFALIIAFGVDFVLEEFIKLVLEKENTDNYRLCNYHFEFGEDEGIKYCHIYWGLPTKILTQILKLPQNRLLL